MHCIAFLVDEFKKTADVKALAQALNPRSKYVAEQERDQTRG
jgi:hypothetical protein